MERKRRKYWFWVGGLLLATLITAFFTLSMGTVPIPPSKVLHILLYSPPGLESSVLWKIRLPRMILGVVVGGALALSGVIFQGMFRNPLVEPYTLGISGGAALGVTIGMLSGWKAAWALPLTGFLGAMGAMTLVYTVASRKGYLKLSTLLLTGVMVSFLSTSLVLLLIALARFRQLQGILFWLMGSLGETNITLIRIVVIVVLGGSFVSYFFSRDLNALSLGEEEALHLGVNVERTKTILFLLASLITGVSVSITGIIGFVGLVIPHMMRMMVGSDHRILLLTSGLCGGIFLLICDSLARSLVSPVELPVGVITGIIGGITFIIILTRKGIEFRE